MRKAKIILAIYNHLPKPIKNIPLVNDYLCKIAEKQITEMQKELIQKKWQLIQCKRIFR